MLSQSFWREKRVLLTGHTGFKGSWLLLWLQELGAHVWTFSLGPEPAPNLFCHLANKRPPGNNWHHHIGNLSDLDSLKCLVQQAQPQVVFHLAAQSLVRRSYEDPLGTKYLLTEGCFCSSSARKRVTSTISLFASEKPQASLETAVAAPPDKLSCVKNATFIEEES